MATLFLIQNETPRLVADFDALGKTSLVLGRRADCEITLSDGAVSGHHLRFDFDGAAWTVTDLDSSNGTEVDGNPIGTARLSEGSRIVLGGETELVFSLASPGEAEAAAPSAAPKASEDDLALVRAMRANTDRIRREIAKVIVGQHDVV